MGAAIDLVISGAEMSGASSPWPNDRSKGADKRGPCSRPPSDPRPRRPRFCFDSDDANAKRAVKTILKKLTVKSFCLCKIGSGCFINI